MAACFWNYWCIGPSNQDFTFTGVVKQLTSGTYPIATVLDDFLDKIQVTTATIRLSLSNTGHLTLDNNGGGVFSITWDATGELRDLLGFTGNVAGANTYTAPRRIRGSFYLEHGGGPLAATIGEFDPKPRLSQVTQTVSLGGVRRTTRSGVVVDAAEIAIQNIDNTARYVSPSGAVGDAYSAASAGALGLYSYTHARDIWWDSTNVTCQGWNDGRPVQYLATAPTVAASIAPSWPAAADFSTWVMDEGSCTEWTATKVRPPRDALYNITLKAAEYIAP